MFSDSNVYHWFCTKCFVVSCVWVYEKIFCIFQRHNFHNDICENKISFRWFICNPSDTQYNYLYWDSFWKLIQNFIQSPRLMLREWYERLLEFWCTFISLFIAVLAKIIIFTSEGCNIVMARLQFLKEDWHRHETKWPSVRLIHLTFTQCAFLLLKITHCNGKYILINR